MRITSAIIFFSYLLVSASPRTEQKPPFTLGWVNAEFSCKSQYGNTKVIDSYSQVFSFCAAETFPQAVARGDRANLEQAAKASCGSGTLTMTSLGSGSYHSMKDMAGAQKELNDDRTANLRLGNIITDFHVTTPYSGVCQ
jgi:hypothetical protein